VIVPDYQLSLAIGKEGQNARLAARLTGWRVDIKSETQLAEEEAYGNQDWAEGEWIIDPETGEQVWQPAEGGPALSAEDWQHAAEDQAAASEAGAGTAGGEADGAAAADKAGASADTSDATDHQAEATPDAPDESAAEPAPEPAADPASDGEATEGAVTPDAVEPAPDAAASADDGPVA